MTSDYSWDRPGSVISFTNQRPKPAGMESPRGAQLTGPLAFSLPKKIDRFALQRNSVDLPALGFRELGKQAARAPDAILKAGFERLAHHWLALAEQAEWLKGRYGAPISVEIFRAESKARVIQQQQQIQPKADNQGAVVASEVRDTRSAIDSVRKT
jgi:hypothetical protein